MGTDAYNDPNFRWLELDLTTVPRRFHALEPLESVGVIHHWYTSYKADYSGNYFGGMEFTIRLSSTSQTMEEEVEGVRHVLHFPNAIIKIPGIRHVQVVNAPRDAVFFRYSAHSAQKFAEYGLLSPPYCWECELSAETLATLQRIIKIVKNTSQPAEGDLLDSIAMQIFTEMLLHKADKDRDTNTIEAKIKRIAVYFHLHYKEPISLEEIAYANGFSRSTFFRHWRKYYDVPPATYILNLRLLEAARLLIESAEKIYQISENLNFDYPEYFCQCFRKKYGISPQQYRNQHTPH